MVVRTAPVVVVVRTAVVVAGVPPMADCTWLMRTGERRDAMMASPCALG